MLDMKNLTEIEEIIKHRLVSNAAAKIVIEVNKGQITAIHDYYVSAHKIYHLQNLGDGWEYVHADYTDLPDNIKI